MSWPRRKRKIVGSTFSLRVVGGTRHFGDLKFTHRQYQQKFEIGPHFSSTYSDASQSSLANISVDITTILSWLVLCRQILSIQSVNLSPISPCRNMMNFSVRLDKLLSYIRKNFILRYEITSIFCRS